MSAFDPKRRTCGWPLARMAGGSLAFGVPGFDVEWRWLRRCRGRRPALAARRVRSILGRVLRIKRVPPRFALQQGAPNRNQHHRLHRQRREAARREFAAGAPVAQHFRSCEFLRQPRITREDTLRRIETDNRSRRPMGYKPQVAAVDHDLVKGHAGRIADLECSACWPAPSCLSLGRRVKVCADCEWRWRCSWERASV